MKFTLSIDINAMRPRASHLDALALDLARFAATLDGLFIAERGDRIEDIEGRVIGFWNLIEPENVAAQGPGVTLSRGDALACVGALRELQATREEEAGEARAGKYPSEAANLRGVAVLYGELAGQIEAVAYALPKEG